MVLGVVVVVSSTLAVSMQLELRLRTRDFWELFDFMLQNESRQPAHSFGRQNHFSRVQRISNFGEECFTAVGEFS